MALKTDFIDGDILYAGTTSDLGKLNGITNEINTKLIPLQIYAGTDLDIAETDGNTITKTLELDTITGLENYGIININGYAKGNCGNNIAGYPVLNLKIERKEVGGSYSDLISSREFFKAGGYDIASAGVQNNFLYYFVPTAGEKANGLVLKVSIIATPTTEYDSIFWTTNQIVIQKI